MYIKEKTTESAHWIFSWPICIKAEFSVWASFQVCI